MAGRSTLNEPLPALIDQLLAVLNLRLDTPQFIEVFSVDRLELLDLLDLGELLLGDDYLPVLVVRRTYSATRPVISK